MSGTGTDAHVFWARLLTVADDLAEPGRTLEDLRAHLLAVDEGFSHTFDPADQFAEHVALLLCRAVRHKLDVALPADN